MDLNELLSFKPKLGKHSLEDPGDEDRAVKIAREDDGPSEEEKALLLLQNMDNDEVEPGSPHSINLCFHSLSYR